MIRLSFAEEPVVNLTVADEPPKNLSIPGQVIIGPDEYQGDYTVTPSQTAQVLLTKSTQLTDNITIEPIPSNYGLITWNGSTLTVS